MECKFINTHIVFQHLFELIDTLWNVNTIWTDFCFGINFELIDTLWNVNQKPSRPQTWTLLN